MSKPLLTATEALEVIKGRGITISRTTLYFWAKKYDIGYQIGGPEFMNPWRFYPDKLNDLLDGKEIMNYGGTTSD